MKCWLWLLLLFLSVLPLPAAEMAYSGNKGNPPVEIFRYLRQNEKLTYVVKWNGFPIGKVSTSVWPIIRKFDGHDTFMFNLMVESNDFLSMFYKIRTGLSSLADTQNGWSYLYRRRAVEDAYHGNDRVIFDYNHVDLLGKKQPMAFPSLIRWEEVEELKPYKLPGMVCDPVTLIWYLRAIALERRGDSAHVLLADRFGMVVVYWNVVKSASLSLPLLGKYDCVVISPEVKSYGKDENLLVDIKGRASLWMEKHTRIILRAEADLDIGRLGVTLVSQDNTSLLQHRIAEVSAAD